MYLCEILTVYSIVCFFCFTISAVHPMNPNEVSIEDTKAPIDLQTKKIFVGYKKDATTLNSVKNSFEAYRKAMYILFKYRIQPPPRLARDADAILLETHIDHTNNTNKGIHLKFAETPESLLTGIKENRTTKPELTRYIFATHGSRIDNNHFAAIDVYIPAGSDQASVIQLEPASFSSKDPNIQLTKSKLIELFKNDPKITFSPVSVGIQNSCYDCLICSLELGKIAHEVSDKMIDMHRENILKGGLSQPFIDDNLPIELLRHQQSSSAIDKFLSRQNTDIRREALTRLKETHREKSCERIVYRNNQRVHKFSNGSIEERRVQLINELPTPSSKQLNLLGRLGLSADTLEQEITNIIQDVIKQ